MPAISVIMPVRNTQDFLSEAVESILNQTFEDFELIIINDCSTDATLDISKKYYKEDKRIVILNNKERLGIAQSLNRGIRHAGGEYLARMDGDDISEINRLQVEKRYLDQHPETGMVGSWFTVIDSTGKFKWHQTPFCDHDDLFNVSIGYNPFVHGSIMMRSEIFDDSLIMGYDPFFEPAEDYELWLRIMENYRVYIIPKFLFNYRRHKDSVCSNRRKEQIKKADLARQNAVERRNLNYNRAFNFSDKWNERCFYYNYGELIKDKEVIIYGNRWLGKKTAILVNKAGCRLKGFLEDDLNKLGKKLSVYHKYTGEEIKEMESVFIIIADQSWKEKRDRLVQDYQINTGRIVYSFYACH